MTMKHRPDSENHPWERIFAQEGRVFTKKLPAQVEFTERFQQHGFRTVLDLGCGNGRHVIALTSQGFEVIGLDISKTGLDLTQQWLREVDLTAHLVLADTRFPLPLPDNAVEGIISTQVIHHAYLAEVQLAINEIYRVLKMGGLAFVTVPSWNRSHKKSVKIEKHTYLPLEGSEAGLPHHIFSKKRLRRAFKSFKINEVSYRDNGNILAIWVEKPL